MTANLFESPSGCGDIANLKYGGYPFFSQNPQFLKGLISKIIAPISMKLKILAFLYKLYKQPNFMQFGDFRV